MDDYSSVHVSDLYSLKHHPRRWLLFTPTTASLPACCPARHSGARTHENEKPVLAAVPAVFHFLSGTSTDAEAGDGCLGSIIHSHTEPSQRRALATMSLSLPPSSHART